MIEMRSAWKRRAAIAVDAVLAIAARPFVRSIGRSLPEHPRVLVIRGDHIGDAVMATAVLQPLRAALAPDRLDVLVGPWAAPALRAHPLVDDLVVAALPWWSAARGASVREQIRDWLRLSALIFRLRRTRYDVAVDLRGDLRQIFLLMCIPGIPERVGTDRTGGRRLLTRCWPYRSGLHVVEQNMAIVGLLGATGHGVLDVPAAVAPPLPLRKGIAAELPNGYVALALRGNEPNRSWPVGHAAALAVEIHRRYGLGCLYLGGPADREFGDQVAATASAPVFNAAGKTSLAESVALLAAAHAAVMVDSGPMHLAAASGVRTIGLFGPGDPRECAPWSPLGRVVTTGAPCGCIHPVCDYVSAGPGRCMLSLTPTMVLRQLDDLLRRE